MILEEALEHAFDGNSVLFVGAGFSLGATNLNGENFKTGHQLSKLLSKSCDIEDDLNLEDSSEFYVDSKGSDSLIRLLSNEYKASTISDGHRTIGRINWKRIYTTNYDNIIEMAYTENSKSIVPITLADRINSIPKKNNCCIHINGFIDKLNRDTLFSEFKLLDTSYASSNFADSLWSRQFRSDLKLAESIFFIGYSLFDLDIKRILFGDEVLQNKTFFVVGENVSNVLTMKIKKYGTIVPLNFDSFSRDIEGKLNDYIPKAPEIKYNCLEIYVGQKNLIPVPDKLIFELFKWGKVSSNAISQSLQNIDNQKYYLKRSEVDALVGYLDNDIKNVIIHSDLGNGKTLFIESAKYNGSQLGYTVYRLKQSGDEANKELEHLFSAVNDKILIIIENYNKHFSSIEFISRMRTDKTVLILSGRSLIHDLVSDRLYELLDDPSLKEFDLNRISDSEIDWFFDVFTDFGLWGDDAKLNKYQKIDILKRVCDKEIHAILLRILQSEKILSDFNELISLINKNPKIYKAIVAIFVLTILEYEVTVELLTDLLGIDIFRDTSFRRHEVVNQLITYDKNSLKAKSSVAAQFILTSLDDSDIVTRTMITLAKSADKLSYYKPIYWQLLKDLNRFGQLQFILPKKNRRPSIINFYESIKNLRGCKNNHFFWFQYAIGCLVIEEYEMAEKFFSTAYSLAEKLKGFDTYQIDNQYARFLLTTAINDENTEYMVNFKQARQLLNKQVQREKRFYPYRIAMLYYDFYEKHQLKFTPNELLTVYKACSYIVNRIDQVQIYGRPATYVHECRTKLNLVIDEIKNSSKIEI